MAISDYQSQTIFETVQRGQECDGCDLYFPTQLFHDGCNLHVAICSCCCPWSLHDINSGRVTCTAPKGQCISRSTRFRPVLHQQRGPSGACHRLTRPYWHGRDPEAVQTCTLNVRRERYGDKCAAALNKTVQLRQSPLYSHLHDNQVEASAGDF